MPAPESSHGRAYIWIVSCILFLCIVAGGVCLGAYMVLPKEEVASWLPVVGLTLVCLPWAFWILTFVYRVISRACGFRVRAGDGVAGGAGGEGGGGNARNSLADVDVEDGRGQASGDGKGGGAAPGGLQRASSVTSHESEMPLAKSMNSGD